MITVIARDTCKPAYVDEKLIQHIEEISETIGGRVYPFSRIFVKDEKQGHEFSLDVVESKNKVDRLIKQANK